MNRVSTKTDSRKKCFLKKPHFIAAIIVLLAFSPFVSAGISVTLPYEENFDSGTYQSGLVWTTQGATHQWLSSGGWQGSGAAKFTPPTNGQGYSGLGEISINNRPNQLNLRFLIYWGSRYTADASNEGNKWAIFNRTTNADGDRIIALQHSYSGASWQPGICQNTDCRFQQGSKFDISQWSEQWVSIEFEGAISAGMMKVYISTQDGTYNDSAYLVENNSSRSSEWQMIQILGGFFNGGGVASPNNYFLIDEVKIDSQHIGPPPGFMTDPPPAAPTSLIVIQ